MQDCANIENRDVNVVLPVNLTSPQKSVFSPKASTVIHLSPKIYAILSPKASESVSSPKVGACILSPKSSVAPESVTDIAPAETILASEVAVPEIVQNEPLKTHEEAETELKNMNEITQDEPLKLFDAVIIADMEGLSSTASTKIIEEVTQEYNSQKDDEPISKRAHDEVETTTSPKKVKADEE